MGARKDFYTLARGAFLVNPERRPTTPVCVQVEFDVMQQVRRVCFQRRLKKQKPWSQNAVFTEALKLWLKKNPE